MNEKSNAIAIFLFCRNSNSNTTGLEKKQFPERKDFEVFKKIGYTKLINSLQIPKIIAQYFYNLTGLFYVYL